MPLPKTSLQVPSPAPVCGGVRGKVTARTAARGPGTRVAPVVAAGALARQRGPCGAGRPHDDGGVAKPRVTRFSRSLALESLADAGSGPGPWSLVGLHNSAVASELRLHSRLAAGHAARSRSVGWPGTTTKSFGSMIDPSIELLGQDVRVLAEQTIAVGPQRLGDFAGRLDPWELMEINVALRVVLDLE